MSSKSMEILVRGVLVHNGRLLVCRTGDAPIVYLPGGHVEFGETVKEALGREILEELGCRATVGSFLGGIQHSFIQQRQLHWEINLVFTMTAEGLPSDEGMPIASEDHLSFEWVELERLEKAGLEPRALCRQLPLWLAGLKCERWIEPAVLT